MTDCKRGDVQVSGLAFCTVASTATDSGGGLARVPGKLRLEYRGAIYHVINRVEFVTKNKNYKK